MCKGRRRYFYNSLIKSTHHQNQPRPEEDVELVLIMCKMTDSNCYFKLQVTLLTSSFGIPEWSALERVPPAAFLYVLMFWMLVLKRKSIVLVFDQHQHAL